jgi:hypothetical protein
MKKSIWHFTMVVIMAAILLLACSGGSDGDSEKGAIRQMTDQVADEMVHKMRSPIDKARAAKEQGDHHMDELEDAVEDTEENE